MTTALTTTMSTPARRFALSDLVGKAPWAVVDQMVISATNMITMVLLARGLTQADFGGFILVYSALLFANSLQSGLITQPHNILGAGRHDDAYRRYTTSTALSQWMLASIAALLTVATWSVGLAMGWSFAPLLAALAPAIAAWQVQEFVRRVLYTEGRVAAAAANDLISYGGQVLIIAALWRANALTGELALLTVALTNTLGAAIGLWQIRRSLMRNVDFSAMRENWHFGKWLAGGEIAGVWLSAQLFVYLAAGALGAAAAGILRAVHTLFGPARILSYVMRLMLPISFAKSINDEGDASMQRKLRAMLIVAVPLFGGYCILVAMLADPLMRLAFGDEYAGYSSVVALYALAMFISYIAMIIISALKAQRRTRRVFFNRVAASLVAIPIGVAMIHYTGLHGAVGGMIASYTALIAMSLYAYRGMTARDQKEAS